MKAREALALVVKSPMLVTKSTMKARAAIAKVKWAATPATGMGEGGEVRPSNAQESVPSTSEIHLLVPATW